MKRIMLLLVIMFLSNMALAIELDDVNFVKPHAYRVGVTDEVETPIDYDIKTQKANVKYIEGEKSEELTYADLSIKKISAQISESVLLDNEYMSGDLAILWQGAAQKSDTIKYIIYKLSNPDKDKPDSSSVKKVLTNIASMSTLLGASTGNPMLACASLIGGNTLGIMSQDAKALNYKYTRVNDADMIILVRKVDELQQKILDCYFDYMTAKDLLNMTQKMTESRLTNFEAAQGCSKEVILVLDAYYRESLNQLTKAKWEFNDARSRLEQIVGADALKQFENNLKTRKS